MIDDVFSFRPTIPGSHEMSEVRTCNTGNTRKRMRKKEDEKEREGL